MTRKKRRPDQFKHPERRDNREREFRMACSRYIAGYANEHDCRLIANPPNQECECIRTELLPRLPFKAAKRL